jgi:hypothetical protein
MRILAIAVWVFLVAFGGRAVCVGQPAAPSDPALLPQQAADPRHASIGDWVASLESDTYAARRRATEQLILAGEEAIDPILKAMEQGGLETIARGVFILRQQALTATSEQTNSAAYAALQQVAARQFTSAARHAASALQAVHETRRQQAQRRLLELGAVISQQTVLVAMQQAQAFPSLTFGPNWRGTLDDLNQLHWITDDRASQAGTPWMIIFEGNKVTNDWVKKISHLENIVVIKIKQASINDSAIAQLVEAPDLQILEVLYSPITDAAVNHLVQLPKIERLRLYGNNISTAAADRLKQMLAQADIDLRKGGFLGIGCQDNPCRITNVQEGSVAAAAGFRVMDVISRYNDQPVQTMDQLTRLISQHAAGERVKVELLREEERLVKEVELGRWE